MGEGIFECYHFGQNGSGVVCLGKGSGCFIQGIRVFYSGIHEMCESF